MANSNDADNLVTVDTGRSPAPASAVAAPPNEVELRALAQRLQQRAAELARLERALRDREAEWEQQYRLLRVEARDAAQRELAEAGERLRRQTAALQAQAAELEARQRDLLQRERKLEQRSAETDRQREALRQEQERLTREREEGDRRRRELGEQTAELARRLQRLESLQQQLRGRAALQEDQARRLAQTQTALAGRQAAIEERLRQADATLAAATRQRESVQALHEQAEARDADVRQAHLALELEREALVQERQSLLAERERLTEQQTQCAAELADLRTAAPANYDASAAAPKPLAGGPRFPWRRGGGVALLVATLAAWGAWRAQPPFYRVAAELSVAGAETLPAWVLAEHERRLLTPDVVPQALGDGPLARAWTTARAEGRIEITRVADRAAVEVAACGPAAEPLRDLLERACAAYQQSARTWPLATPDTAAREQLSRQRAALLQRVEQRQTEVDQRQARLADLPEAAQRESLRVRVAQSRGDYDALEQSLNDQQRRLSEALAAPAPRGVVAPDNYEQALAADEMYAADAREFSAVGVQYRSELIVALLLLQDPLREFHKTLTACEQIIAEQRQLQPPAAVAAALEDGAGRVAVFRERAAAFQLAWQQRLESVRAGDPQEQLAELVRQQHAAASEARQFTVDAAALAEAVRRRLDQLAEESHGDTRAGVVAAILKDALGSVTAAVGAMSRAAEQNDTAKNFRLDALDRQLRGLRTRLEHRREIIRQQMQSDADEQARRVHEAALAALRQAVAEREKRRGELVRELSQQLDELRRLDALVAQRLELEAQQRAAAAEIADLERQLDQLARHPALAAPAELLPPVEIGPPRVAMLRGANRARNAALAGLAGLAATGLVCVLLVPRRPNSD